MSKKTNGAVPRLRFKEFEGEWEEKKLGEVATFLKGKGISKSDIAQDGVLPCIRYGELYTHYKETITTVISYTNLSPDSLVLSQENDVIIPASGETQEDIATASCVLNSGIALGGDLNIVRSDLNGIFLALYLNNAKKKDIAQLTQGISVVHLYPSQLKTLSVCYPSSEEQQKIASTLSSLDELIGAEGDRLQALKMHKRGLMQNLFPAEGETIPRLRFEGFEGEWNETLLNTLTDKVGSGITPKGGDKNYKKKGRPFVRSQNVGWGELLLDDVAYIDEETHATFSSTEIQVNDVLLNITGASIGRCTVADNRIKGGNVNQHVCIIRTKKNISPFFLSQYLISERGQNQIDSFQAGGNRQELNFNQIRSFEIPLPPSIAEQQKIASILSSLDDLITAETQKIDALKLHKKALMQGLFPSTTNITEQ